LSSDYVFLIAAITGSVNILFALFFLPESHDSSPPSSSASSSMPSFDETPLIHSVAADASINSPSPHQPESNRNQHFHKVMFNASSESSPSSSPSSPSFSYNPFKAMSILWKTRFLTTLALITLFEGVAGSFNRLPLSICFTLLLQSTSLLRIFMKFILFFQVLLRRKWNHRHDFHLSAKEMELYTARQCDFDIRRRSCSLLGSGLIATAFL
jgi:hypothetical protein